MSIAPHGGILINRFVADSRKPALAAEAATLPKIEVDAYAAFDIDGIAKGLFSPLQGFMGSEETHRVLETMELRPGVPWTIPILLPVTAEVAASVETGGSAAIVDDRGITVAVMKVTEKFQLDRNLLIEKVIRHVVAIE